MIRKKCYGLNQKSCIFPIPKFFKNHYMDLTLKLPLYLFASYTLLSLFGIPQFGAGTKDIFYYMTIWGTGGLYSLCYGFLTNYQMLFYIAIACLLIGLWLGLKMTILKGDEERWDGDLVWPFWKSMMKRAKDKERNQDNQ